MSYKTNYVRLRLFFFFFQAEDGIRDLTVTGVQTCALPISHSFECGADEVLVLPLSGSCRVDCEGQRFELAGRENVLSAVSDFAYAPLGASVTVFSETGGRFALPSARSRRRLAPRYMAASEVQVELRGAGSCSRQVNNFCTPEVFEADRMVACEGLTPDRNSSSY